MKQQRFTSATTSINDRLPAVVKLMDRAGVSWSGRRVLDYGCGQYPVHVVRAAMDRGAAAVVSYDKYHHVNMTTGDGTGAADLVILSNVLNVIDSPDVRADVVRDCVDRMDGTGTLYVTVYEGDGTGHGKQTGPDAWQENRKTADYIEEIRAAVPGADVVRHGKLIIIQRA